MRRSIGLAIAAPSTAQTATNVSGTWKASFVTEERTYPAVIELKQDGQTLTGNLVSEAKEKISGSVQGTTVSFTFQTLNPGGDGSILGIGVKCALEKEALTGDFTVNDGPGGTFSAQRDAAAPKPGEATADSTAKIDMTGAWALAVDFGTISATPSAVFKQEGEALTGEYTQPAIRHIPAEGHGEGQPAAVRVHHDHRRQRHRRCLLRHGGQRCHQGQRQLRRGRRRDVHGRQKKIVDLKY